MRLKSCRTLGIFILALAVLSGCNRGALRIYGAGGMFPKASAGFYAKNKHAQPVTVAQPVDKTADYYGKSVAGTSWQGTRTDTFQEMAMLNVVRTELSRELEESGLFSAVDTERSNDLTLETEVRAFGAQARGFMFVRIGGVSAFKFTLKRGGTVLFEKVYEKVVKDNDQEYTGSSFGMLEDAMRSAMSDSFREVLQDLFRDLETLSL